MTGPLVVIFHQPPRPDEPPLTARLSAARAAALGEHVERFRAAGAGACLVVTDRAGSFGERLRMVVRDERPRRGLVVLSSGAVPLLRPRDARRLLATAMGGSRRALTNNRFSSDVCAIPDAHPLRSLPDLSSDNVLPRWLEERAGMRVQELPGRQRLGIDIDSPLDLALLRATPRLPRSIRAATAGLRVPRRRSLRTVAADPRHELVVVGRTGSRTLAWLEGHVRCRVRFLAEERGLKAGSGPGAARPPASVLGMLLAGLGPGALGSIITTLGDAAIIDSRVLLAARLGGDETGWPEPEDRYASDMLLPERISDPWLRELTAAAADAPIPIQLGAHTLVGPGVRLLLSTRAR